MQHTYFAWMIFSRIVSHGKPIAGYDWCPMYKSIDGMLPFFTTKRQAQEWMSARGMKSGSTFKYQIRRVQVTANCGLNSSETPNS